MTAKVRVPFAPRGFGRRAVYRGMWALMALLDGLARCCLHVAVGVLRRDELRRAGVIGATLYRSPDEYMEAGLEPWEDRIYSSVLRRPSRVLLIGCGGGREVLVLCARGHSVTGIDQAPELVDAARRHLNRRGMTAALIAEPIETAPLSETYDVVIFSACVYGYLQGRASRREILDRLKTHLAPDGQLVLSYTEGSGSPPAILWLVRAAGWITGSDWTPDPEDTFAPGPRRDRLPFYERRMAREAVQRELAEAGFDLVRDEQVGAWRCAVAVVHS
jgi:2-polyprenyl-3-methyl-5-hydroxy-6-metoxy-1,4-benzoquinol methylase